jgi:hypothetical protein
MRRNSYATVMQELCWEFTDTWWAISSVRRFRIAQHPEILLNDRFGQILAFGRFPEEFDALARIHRGDFVHPRTSAIRFATA